ncbi:MAG: FAD-dependent oxidoreductase [Eubacteriales bacterium]|nr:FAD-dependent oxidoreductase [Eubacteriales bacterium]
MSKTVIIGGVAGGASCAARLRRLDENAEIVLLERGAHISYANCGLPYHVGNAIPSQRSLLLLSPQVMRARFNVDVRVGNEVTAINREKKTVSVRQKDGSVYDEGYDTLVIATGSSPARPPIPGIESQRVTTLWTVDDAERIRGLALSGSIRRAAVVGGGFIGLEMAENLKEAGLEVTLIEATDQVMPPLDYEMALPLHQHLRKQGMELRLGDGVAAFHEKEDGIEVVLKSGTIVDAGLVVLSIGVRPNSALAKEAGLELNARGGIRVDQRLRTSDPTIYAVGDVIEVDEPVLGGKAMIPLAGPANRQGRIAADNLAGGAEEYVGTQGTSVAKVFDLTAAGTGVNEKTLIARGMELGKDYERVIIVQNHHAGYYPGAEPMVLKLLFAADGSRIFGAQIVGRDGVDKRIDVLATAIRLGATVAQLKDLELAYAPPYSSAKDPVNMLGFVAENLLRGQTSFADWNVLEKDSHATVLDIREAGEVSAYALPHSLWIPLGELRSRMHELPKDRELVIFCGVGVRAHTAERILRQHGFEKVRVYPGGMYYYRLTHA